MAGYNLIIIHVPGRQQISDFHTIRDRMRDRAPDIEVHVVSVATPVPPGFWRRMAERPSVIFSPMPIPLHPRLRGARLLTVDTRKSDEIRMLTEAGFPVPETRLIVPDLTLDAARWGPFTVVKPDVGFRGRGVVLKRTRHVRFIDTTLLPKDDPRRGRRLLAQRYVHTGPQARCYRVMTVLGRPIYALCSTATEDLPLLDPEGSDDIDVQVAANGGQRRLTLTDDAEVLALARAVAAKLTYVPVFGIDIVRAAGTNELYILELNSSGRTWHISSDHGLHQQHEEGIDFCAQFDALGTITEALIETTRRRAV